MFLLKYELILQISCPIYKVELIDLITQFLLRIEINLNPGIDVLMFLSINLQLQCKC